MSEQLRGKIADVIAKTVIGAQEEAVDIDRQTADAILALPEMVAALKAEAQRDEARAAIRRMQDAIRGGATTAATVALALCSIGEGRGPSLLDERDAAFAERDRALKVVEAAQMLMAEYVKPEHAKVWRSPWAEFAVLSWAVDEYDAAVSDRG